MNKMKKMVEQTTPKGYRVQDGCWNCTLRFEDTVGEYDSAFEVLRYCSNLDPDGYNRKRWEGRTVQAAGICPNHKK